MKLTPEQLADIRDRRDKLPRYENGKPDIKHYEIYRQIDQIDQDNESLCDHITAMEAEKAELVKYTVHKSQCGTNFSHYAPCSCGLSQLKYGAELLKQEQE